MKKIILIFTIVLSVSAVAFWGCKKGLQEEQQQAIFGSTEAHANTLGISVNSEYGFLVFETVADLDAYRDFLRASTHAEVQEYLSGIDFPNSLGAALYDEKYYDDHVSEEQAADYIVNAHRIFQLQGVVMKPIEEWTGCTTAP